MRKYGMLLEHAYPFLGQGILLTTTCFYLENQVFGSVAKQDMLLKETCFWSRLYGNENQDETSQE